eukprot:GCRY01004191.1.p1 GENE.GCRY01004191.1~~GCRY01004191.1.p1  ORF type:complete len:389 (-),score=65.86 GCRY01004191.1:112-1278(-)
MQSTKKTEQVEDLYPFQEKVRTEFRSQFHQFICQIVESKTFSAVIMVVILANAVTIALSSNLKDDDEDQVIYETIDLLFLVVYTLEMIVKVYADPIDYWKSGYNRFDVAILVFSYLQIALTTGGSGGSSDYTYLRVIRALRALRALRSIAFVKSLQVIVSALLKTMFDIVNILALMILIIFVFAITGHYLWGSNEDGDTERWGTLPKAMWSLFAISTADGWTYFQGKLDDLGYKWSRLFTILFIFVGHFIFINLFIGVIIENLDEATEEDRKWRHLQRSIILSRKKEFIIMAQQRDLDKLLRRKARDESESLDHVIAETLQRLNHSHVMPTRLLAAHTTWAEAYLATLTQLERSMYRTQQFHFHMVKTIADALEEHYYETELIPFDPL